MFSYPQVFAPSDCLTGKNKIMLHKQMFFLMVLAGTMAAAIPAANACELEFQVETPKESYKAGDEVVVNVTLILTHRNCRVSPDETQFSGEGIEILGATKWAESGYNRYSRKIKIKITGGAGIHKLTALRQCQKDGAKGSMIFKTS